VAGRVGRHEAAEKARAAVAEAERLRREAEAVARAERDRLAREHAAELAAMSKAAPVSVAPPSAPVPREVAKGVPLLPADSVLTLAEVNAKLGFMLSETFVARTLGVPPIAKLYSPGGAYAAEQFQQICERLVAHVAAVSVQAAIEVKP